KALLLAAVFTLLIGAAPAMLTLIGNGTLAAMAVFVAAGLAAGHWLGGPAPENRVVLAMSAASRHPAIALAVARANFPYEPRLGATVVLYVIVATLGGLAYVAWHRRRHS